MKRYAVLAAALLALISISGTAQGPLSWQETLEASLDAYGPGNEAEAIQVVLDSLPTVAQGEQRPRLVLPYRDAYVLNDHDQDGAALTINNPCALDLNGSVLQVPSGVDGVRFTAGAHRAELTRGAIRYQTFDYHTGIAVVIEAHGVRVDDLRITRPYIGVRVDGRDVLNANLVHLAHLEIFRAHEAGVHTIGGDSNAGFFEEIEVLGAGVTQYGFLDESFLGNATTAFHVSSTLSEAYLATGGANYSTHQAFYVENDSGQQLPNGVSDSVADQPRITWFGGSALAYAQLGDRVGTGFSRLVFRARTTDSDVIVQIPDVSVANRPTALLAYRIPVYPGDNPDRRVMRLSWHDYYQRAGIFYSQTGPYDNGLTAPITWPMQLDPTITIDRTQSNPAGRVP